MAMVPDLGSDFAQRLLLDLRRRRERLGFESSSTSSSQQQQRTPPRDACSNSQKPLRSQKPQQRAPPPGARRPPESSTTTQRSPHQQQGSGGNAIAMAGKPRRRRADIAAADAHAIVPFQGAGGAQQNPIVDVQMAALALALSSSNGGGSGKLRHLELVARNGSVFFRDPDMAAAIGARELNDMLLAYSSGGGRRRTRSSAAAMNLEESLSMLLMLQDASGYDDGMEFGSGRKVLLLKGKGETRKSLSPSSSARIVEIVDEDSDAEQAKDRNTTSTQIVAYKNSDVYQSPNSSSVVMASGAAGSSNSKINGASEGEKDGSKVRMPSVIAKLMGLDNLPSSAPVKAVPERKGTEKFVRPEALPRKEIRANSMDRKLPIRIVASEKGSSRGQHKILLTGDWETGVTNCGGFEFASALSSSPSHPPHGGNKQVRQTMGQVLRKMVGTERGDGASQGVDERIIHEDKITLAEEIKLQIPVSIGSRGDAGKKMDFLKRFRKSSESGPAMEDKHTTEEKSTGVGKKQDTIMKRLLGRDSETKSRRARDKINKENLATTETNVAGKNGRTDQTKRQAQNKHTDRKTTRKKAQNCRNKTHTQTPAQNLEDKNPVISEAPHMRKKLEYTVVTEQENVEHTQVNGISFSKPSDSTHCDVGFSEQLARAVTGSSTTGAASLDQTLKDVTEETNDPTTIDVAVVQESEDSKFLDQSPTVEMMNDGRIDHGDSETTQIPETFTEEDQQQEEQQQQQQQQMIVKEQLTDGPDHTTKSTNPTILQHHKTHVVSCDSFTESQLLLMQLLLKDRYLLETAKSIIKVDAPVNLVINAGAGNWSDKCNGLLSDVTQEVTRRKAKRTEAMEGVAGDRKLRYLDDLVRELDIDIQSLDMCRKPQRRDEDGTAEILGIVLERDIENNRPDANSTWDYGWEFRVSELPVEKNEVVRDLEKNILGGIITDVARDLIGVSLRHGCWPCVV